MEQFAWENLTAKVKSVKAAFNEKNAVNRNSQQIKEMGDDLIANLQLGCKFITTDVLLTCFL